MDTLMTKIVILGLMAIIIGVPVLYRPPEAKVPEGALQLVIVSPHNEQIRYETEQAFRNWHEEKYGEPIVIVWRNLGGTKDIERALFSSYGSLANANRENEGSGFDIVFGGGDYFFGKLKRGITVKQDDGIERKVSITEPVELDEKLVASAYTTQLIADKPLYDPDGHWWGVVLSSFGIVYNRDLLENVHEKTVPEQWSDLADFQYFHQLALADPGKSGSVNLTYEAVLQRYGWDHGIWTLRRMLANARYFTASSSKVPSDVSAGDALAGVCIDFYGRFQAEAVGDGDRVGFVAPDGATVVTCDPVAVLRGTKNKELAKRFIEFLITREGQAIWNFPVGAEVDGLQGPKQFSLRRAPIRRDMYADYLKEMVDQTDPYTIARALPEGIPGYYDILPTMMHSMAMDIHSDIKAAWKVIHEEPEGPNRDAMLAKFDALPFTQDEIVSYAKGWRAERKGKLEPGTTPGKRELRLKWTKWFRNQYEEIVAMRTK